jgi:intracellular sulfur oxidation DsrE/DsrF family protein
MPGLGYRAASLRGNTMKLQLFAAAFCVLASTALADPVQLRPVVPEADGWIVIPKSALQPDPKLTYKVVFDSRKGADKPTQLAPAINLAASELNTFVAAHVKHWKMAMVFHGSGADDALLDNAHYKKKYGVDNPNLKPLAEMRKAGVEIYVCGEQLIGDGIDFAWLTPDVTVANDGLIALMVFQSRGYAQLTF